MAEEDVETCPQLQKQEIFSLKSIYSEEGECVVFQAQSESGSETISGDLLLSDVETLFGSGTIHIIIVLKIQTEHMLLSPQVKFSLPPSYPKYEPPIISIICDHIVKDKMLEVLEDIRSFSKTLLPEPCIFNLLERIKDRMSNLKSSELQVSTTAEKISYSPEKAITKVFICITKLDHMRNEQKYFKLLNSWAKELVITGKVLKMGRCAVYVVLLGDNKAISEFIKRWKTQNVDIDSHGKSCKEKMMSILCQQQIEMVHHIRSLNDGLEFVLCSESSIDEQFQDKNIKELIKKLI